jgi:hypothetical protein
MNPSSFHQFEISPGELIKDHKAWIQRGALAMRKEIIKQGSGESLIPPPIINPK